MTRKGEKKNVSEAYPWFANLRQNQLKLWCLVVGVWVTFTAFGWATEALTQTEFGEQKERFKFTWFLVLLQSMGNAAVAAVMLTVGNGGRPNFTAGVPIRDWIIVAAAYLGAHKFGLLSLMYIVYPLQVLVKSCKAVPVMFGEVLFGTASLSLGKVLSVAVLCAGVVVFTLGKDTKSIREGTNAEVHLDEKTVIGLSLAGFALVCDGIYGPYQNRIKKQAIADGRKVNSYHLMYNMNLYQGLLALGFILYTNELPAVVDFVKRNPEVLKPIVNFAAAMALGNIFVFQLQADFGSLVVTKTTTVRKVITILFSVYYFNHTIHPGQWLGILLVFASEPVKMLADWVAARPTGKHKHSD
eukprot:Hpha_TRINITY_DN16398_c1_g1::TRINITY_DN16398_c1_g1_i1::g.62828::m.62828/K15275/SLC35B1; solute carrier family 35 (UDP-galactose transporter), member B1